MRQIRQNVFETNSSSTHSITICTQEEYDLFLENELMYDTWTNELVPYSRLLLKTESSRYHDYCHLGDCSCGNLETYSTNFTTPSGDKMVAFGRYGYDG